ncbi:hypothetical protein [Pedobacter nutrimenti]|uniref:Type IV secretion system protein VirB5 n=1 Tax=Pedobacter nutrimenti TaxID=1241337 RepID=A0A318U976_9SPHI|nr:hypothetical protein [Pedobacter nutrimenti]PYF68436.1 hypothetical protein B0O44_11220 [Pedobacter nutrimenti]
MKNFLLIILLALPGLVRAQFAVVDVSPDKKIFQVKNIANQVQQLAAAAKQNETLINAYQTALKTKQDISDMLRLQDEARRALLTVRNIKDLNWSDMSNVFSRVAGVSLDYSGLIPSSTQGDASRIFTKGSGFGSGATNIFYKASGRTTSKNITSEDLAIRTQSSFNTQLSLDDASSVRKLQVASYYDDMAEDLIKKSVQLSAAINSEGKLSMSSAERLALQKNCNEAIMQSVDLRLKADELRKTALVKTTAQKEQTRRESLQLMRKELANYESKTNSYGYLGK